MCVKDFRKLYNGFNELLIDHVVEPFHSTKRINSQQVKCGKNEKMKISKEVEYFTNFFNFTFYPRISCKLNRYIDSFVILYF